MTGLSSPGRLRAADPAVSVLMPVRNGERFIGEAIASVLAQSQRDFELIVVDDGSTDDTAGIVRGFRDDRIVMIQSPGAGISRALNAGLARCRAPLVARLDSDDFMEPHRLARQLAFLAENPSLGGAASYYWIMDEEGTRRGHQDPALLTIEDLELQLTSGGRLIYAHPTLMLRRDVVVGLGGYDPRFDTSEDVELTLRMYEAGWPILVQPERLTRFRIHGGSLSASNTRRQYFLNAATFGNFRRRRRGEEGLPMEAYRRRAERNPLLWIAAESQIASHLLRRRATQAHLGARPVTAALLLTFAAALHPAAAAGAVFRSGLRGWRRRRAGVSEPQPPKAPIRGPDPDYRKPRTSSSRAPEQQEAETQQ